MIEATFNVGDVNELAADVRRKLAERLLRVAVYFQTQHKARLSKPNPPPHKDSSKPGEYPRLRTGFGRGSTVYDPSTVDEIARDLSVKVGYLAGAWYMPFLELHRERLGLLKTLDDLRPQLQALAEKG